MKSFIRATEIWIPSKYRTSLVLRTGLYGNMRSFREASERLEFSFGEGLPGRAWLEATPIILRDFDNRLFKRADIARKEGLTVAIALPIFVGEVLQAVVVFLCGDEGDLAGAIEVWGENQREEMSLVEGYYGTLERFEWISRRISFVKGKGLPGSIWQTRTPQIIEDLGQSDTFMRARNAAEAGITVALGIPCFCANEPLRVMVFLSAAGTPIARRFEIWQPDEQHRELKFASGHCDTGADLQSAYRKSRYTKGEGYLGVAWLTGTPQIEEGISLGDSSDSPSTSLLAIPVFDGALLQSVVVFYI